MWSTLDAATLGAAGGIGLAIGLALAWLHRRGVLGRLPFLLVAPPLALAPLAWALARATGADDWLEGLRCAGAVIVPGSVLIWLAAHVAGLDYPQEEKEAMSLVSKLDLEARRRWAAENILNSEALTDDLADPEATRLVAWATERAKAVAEETAGLSPAEAEAALDERLTALRKLVRGINKLAGETQPADPDRVQRRLERLAEAAEALDLKAPDEGAMAAYVREQEGLEAGSRLEQLLRLFGEEGAPTEDALAPEETP
jgi:hypothetical protein